MKLKVTQVKSVIDRPKKQKDTLYALGLRKMNQVVVKDATPQVVGMLGKVKHLVNIEEA